MNFNGCHNTKEIFTYMDDDNVVYRFESKCGRRFSSYLIYPTFGSPRGIVTRGIYFTKRVEHYEL